MSTNRALSVSTEALRVLKKRAACLERSVSIAAARGLGVERHGPLWTRTIPVQGASRSALSNDSVVVVVV